jgi:hypothetical protein
MQLDGSHYKGRHQHKAVKSSLKGSKSQLSLEEVAQAARRNAARQISRLKAQTALKDLLQKFDEACKVCVPINADREEHIQLNSSISCINAIPLIRRGKTQILMTQTYSTKARLPAHSSHRQWWSHAQTASCPCPRHSAARLQRSHFSGLSHTVIMAYNSPDALHCAIKHLLSLQALYMSACRLWCACILCRHLTCLSIVEFLSQFQGYCILLLLPLPLLKSHFDACRTRGNIATPGIAAQVKQILEDSGARLVVVMGHTRCAAVDRAIDAWLDRASIDWPWAAAAQQRERLAAALPPHWQPAQSLGPPKPPGSAAGGGSSSDGGGPKQEPTRTDKISTMGMSVCAPRLLFPDATLSI